MNAAEFVASLGAAAKPTQKGRGYMVRCPAHDDKNPSLSVDTSPDGKLLLHCFAGCNYDAIMAAAGRPRQAAFPPKPSPPTPKKIVATYQYTDAGGKLRFEVVRFEPKGFAQRQPDGGRWRWDLQGVEPVLFRLPEISAAIWRGSPILIPEGEKDVLRLVKAGFEATCNAGGAGKWRDTYSDSLAGADCYVVPDNDKPGLDHAADVAASLRGKAASVRIVRLPDEMNGRKIKDVSDFFDAGGTGADLMAIRESPEPSSQPEPADLPGNDDPPEPGDGLPPMVDAADFCAEPVAQPPELVAGLLHQGSKLVLGGASKAHKTWAMLDLAISVANGLPWLGRDTIAGNVLYLNFEIQDYAWQKRIAAVAQAKGVTLKAGSLKLWNLRGKAADYQTLLPRIIAATKQAKFALIVLDPIYKLYGRTDENKAGDVAALLNGMESLAVETGAAIAFGAHFSKGNQAGKEAMDRISGSGVFARDPDSILIFTKHETEDAFTVESILRNFAPVEPFVVRWDYPLFHRDGNLDPAKLKQAGGRKPEHTPEHLLKLLPAGGAENSQWLAAAEGRGISKRTYYRLRNLLEEEGRVLESKVNGKWMPITKRAN